MRGGVYGQSVSVDGLVAWLNSPPAWPARPHAPSLARNVAPRCGGSRAKRRLWPRSINSGTGSAAWSRSKPLGGSRSIRPLILAVDGDKVPKQIYPTAMPESPPAPSSCSLSRNHRILASGWARRSATPKFLLMHDTPIEHVIEYLNVRHGRRRSSPATAVPLARTRSEGRSMYDEFAVLAGQT